MIRIKYIMKKTLTALLCVLAFNALAQSSLNKKTDKLASEIGWIALTNPDSSVSTT